MNCFLTLLLALLLVKESMIDGFVIRASTLGNPCSSDPTSDGASLHASLRDQVQATITAANTTDTKCQQYKDALATGQVLIASEIHDLDSTLQNVPGIPLGVNEPALTAANNITSFMLDYQDISVYIRYIDFFRALQVASDGGRFLVEIDAVKSQFYVWLCTIDTILRSHNSPVTDFVSSSVVSAHVQQYASDSKGRHKLNYVLMKNAQEFIANKELKLATYFLTLS